jgi:hypothetical protein
MKVHKSKQRDVYIHYLFWPRISSISYKKEGWLH